MGAGGSNNFRPGDWFCDQCKDHNFASRKVCRKCGAERGDAVVSVGEDGSVLLPETGGTDTSAAHGVVVPGADLVGPDGSAHSEVEQRGAYGW